MQLCGISLAACHHPTGKNPRRVLRVYHRGPKVRRGGVQTSGALSPYPVEVLLPALDRAQGAFERCAGPLCWPPRVPGAARG